MGLRCRAPNLTPYPLYPLYPLGAGHLKIKAHHKDHLKIQKHQKQESAFNALSCRRPSGASREAERLFSALRQRAEADATAKRLFIYL